MYLKHKFPLQLKIILEKSNSVVYTSDNLDGNNYFVFVNKKWYSTINNVLCRELSLHNTSLVDMSAIDTINYNSNLFGKLNVSLCCDKLVYNIYYMPTLKLRIILLCNVDKQLSSIDRFFNNANWIERELSEMYGITFIGKNDSRKLLLDYTNNNKPLLKESPLEGNSDNFYSFLDNQVIPTTSRTLTNM